MQSVFPEIWIFSNHRAINQISAPAKTFIIQFRIQVSTNNQWLAYISRYCTFHTFTNITITFISIDFAALWNVWFSKTFFKIHWSDIFFFFHMSFLKIKIWHFLLLFFLFFSCFEWSTLFLLSKIEFLFSLPFLSRVRLSIDWLTNLIYSSTFIGSFK